MRKNIFLSKILFLKHAKKHKTRRKVLKVAKIKDANFGCKDEGNEVISQSAVMCMMVCVMLCVMVCVMMCVMLFVM